MEFRWLKIRIAFSVKQYKMVLRFYQWQVSELLDRGFSNDLGFVFWLLVPLISATMTSSIFYLVICDEDFEAAQPHDWICFSVIISFPS